MNTKNTSWYISTGVICIVFLFHLHGKSQDTCGFFKTDSIIWYGLDFSKTKMVGPGFNNPTDIKKNFFRTWNNLIIYEPDKFNLWYFFDKSYVDFKLDPATKRNLSIDENNMVSYNSSYAPLEETEIANIINEYDFETTKGYGVLLIVESFNNYDKKGYFDLVFIDLKTKSIILSKKISGTVHGVGFRNYWAGAIYGALFNFPYIKWKKEYCIKNK
jgi:hypothetical protein